VVLVAVGEIIARRKRELGEPCLEVTLANHDQLLRLIEMQRLQQHGIDHREDGAIGADAKRKGEDGHARESGVPGERAKRVAEIVEKHEAKPFDVRPSPMVSLAPPAQGHDVKATRASGAATSGGLS
jgi:hypothetical protein